MEKVTVGDVEICYRFVGEGDPLVMIIGFTANMDWWSPRLVEALSGRNRLLLMDNRGAGRSTSGRRRFTMSQFARDTAGMMEALGVARANVMASSMGGMIAQELALGYPEKVEKLVLNCTACGGLRMKLPRLGVIRPLIRRKGTQAEHMEKNIDVLFPKQFIREHPEILDQLVDAINKAPATDECARRQAIALATFSSYRRLPSIKSPTLVMAGTEDILIPPKNSEILAERIPGARLRFFEGAGHRFTAQYPLEVAEAVDGFLYGD